MFGPLTSSYNPYIISLTPKHYVERLNHFIHPEKNVFSIPHHFQFYFK